MLQRVVGLPQSLGARSRYVASEESLEHLMRRSREGDRDAFAELCELRRSGLAAELNRKMGPGLRARVDPSDVIQEVFLDANLRFREVASTSVPLVAWLRYLCKQKLVELQRRHIGAQRRSIKRETFRSVDYTLDSIANQLVANLTSPSMQVHRQDIARRVRLLLAELPPLDREILVLRHFEQMSNGEVAESLGLSANAASNRYVRALRRFKDLLKITDSKP